MVTQKHYFIELLRWHSGKRIHLLRQEMQIRSLGEEDAPRGGHGNPIQHSCLGNSMDRGLQFMGSQGVRHTPENTCAH